LTLHLGFGQWEAVHCAAKLPPDKTPAHCAAFCRRFVLEAAAALPAGACPALLAAASSAASTDGDDPTEAALPPAEGGDAMLSALYATRGFAMHVRARAAEDLARLELLQPLVDAVVGRCRLTL
jgi:chromodomain-helicase-DNA-binding protein 6